MASFCTGFSFTKLPGSTIRVLNSTELFWCSLWDYSRLILSWMQFARDSEFRGGFYHCLEQSLKLNN